jgi:hypothetical protein
MVSGIRSDNPIADTGFRLTPTREEKRAKIKAFTREQLGRLASSSAR